MNYRNMKTAAVILSGLWLILKILSLLFIRWLAFMRGFLAVLLLIDIVCIVMMFVLEPEKAAGKGKKKLRGS